VSADCVGHIVHSEISSGNSVNQKYTKNLRYSNILQRKYANCIFYSRLRDGSLLGISSRLRREYRVEKIQICNIKD
jgi:hypothetical protein